jgi:hypothetical protein
MEAWVTDTPPFPIENPVSSSWVIAEDISQGDIFEVSYKLPLLVEKYLLNMINNELLSVSV